MKKVTAKSLVVKKEILSDWFHYFNDKMLLGKLEKDINDENKYHSNYRSYLSLDFDKNSKEIVFSDFSNPKKHKKSYDLEDINQPFYSNKMFLKLLEQEFKNKTYRNVLVEREGIPLMEFLDKIVSGKDLPLNGKSYSKRMMLNSIVVGGKKSERGVRDIFYIELDSIEKTIEDILLNNIEFCSFNFASNFTRLNNLIKEVKNESKKNTIINYYFNRIIMDGADKIEKSFLEKYYDKFLKQVVPFLFLFQFEKQLKTCFSEFYVLKDLMKNNTYTVGKTKNFVNEILSRENHQEEIRSFLKLLLEMDGKRAVIENFNQIGYFNSNFLPEYLASEENYGDLIALYNINKNILKESTLESLEELKQHYQLNKHKPIDFKAVINFMKFIFNYYLFNQEVCYYKKWLSNDLCLEKSDFTGFIDEIYNDEFIDRFYKEKYLFKLDFNQDPAAWKYRIGGCFNEKNVIDIFHEWSEVIKIKKITLQIIKEDEIESVKDLLEKLKEKRISEIDLKRLINFMSMNEEIKKNNPYKDYHQYIIDEMKVDLELLINFAEKEVLDFLNHGSVIVRLYNQKKYYQAEKLYIEVKNEYKQLAKNHFIFQLFDEMMEKLDKPISLYKNFLVKTDRMEKDLKDNEPLIKFKYKVIKHILPHLNMPDLMRCYLKIKGKNEVKSIENYNLKIILDLAMLFQTVRGAKEIILDSFNYKEKWFEILNKMQIIKYENEWIIQGIESLPDGEINCDYISHEIYKKKINEEKELKNKSVLTFMDIYFKNDKHYTDIGFQNSWVSCKRAVAPNGFNDSACRVITKFFNDKNSKMLFDLYLNDNKNIKKLPKYIKDKLDLLFIRESDLEIEFVKNKKYSILDFIEINKNTRLPHKQKFLKELIKQSYPVDKIKKFYSNEMAFNDFLNMSKYLKENNSLSNHPLLSDKIESMDKDDFIIFYQQTINQIYDELLNTSFFRRGVIDEVKSLNELLYCNWIFTLISNDIGKDELIQKIKKITNNFLWFFKIKYFFNGLDILRSKLFAQKNTLKDENKKIENQLKIMILLNFMNKVYVLIREGNDQGDIVQRTPKSHLIFNNFLNNKLYTLKNSGSNYRGRTNENFVNVFEDFNDVKALALYTEELTDKMSFSKVAQMTSYYHRVIELEEVKRNQKRFEEMESNLIHNDFLKEIKKNCKKQCLLTKEIQNKIKIIPEYKGFRGILKPLTLQEMLTSIPLLDESLNELNDNKQRLLDNQDKIVIYFPQSEKDLYLQGKSANLCVHSIYKNHILNQEYLLYYSYHLKEVEDVELIKNLISNGDYLGLYNKKVLFEHSTVGFEYFSSKWIVRFDQEREVKNHNVNSEALIDLRILFNKYFNKIIAQNADKSNR